MLNSIVVGQSVTAIQVISPTISAISLVYRTMSLTEPDGLRIGHETWASYDAMINLKSFNKWLSAAAFAGILACILISFDLTDDTPTWAK